MGFTFTRPDELIGSTGTVVREVTSQDTAIAVRSGDLPVLATPALVALWEEASCDALAGHLPHERTTVGSAVDIRHLAPSPIGATVTVSARITEISGARVTFALHATHARGEGQVEIGRGTHTRVVVDRERFVHSL